MYSKAITVLALLPLLVSGIPAPRRLQPSRSQGPTVAATPAAVPLPAAAPAPNAAPVLVGAPVANQQPGADELLAQISQGVGNIASNVVSAVNLATSSPSSSSSASSATSTDLFQHATSILGTSTSQVFASAFTSNGVPIVEVTSVGGPVITLASGSGITTTFAGHTFTVVDPSATASSSSSSASSKGSSNAAMSVNALSFSGPMLVGVAGVVGSMFAGALTIL